MTMVPCHYTINIAFKEGERGRTRHYFKFDVPQDADCAELFDDTCNRYPRDQFVVTLSKVECYSQQLREEG